MSESIRILYMEDDVGLGRLLQKILRKKGFLVDLAVNGQEGLDKLDSALYDIILIDHNMPVHNGIEVISILISRGDLPPTIMLTGSGNEKTAVEAMKLGASDYLVKDVDMRYLELLPMVIERALRDRRTEEEKERTARENERLVKELREALAEVRRLSGLLPICASCKKIRDDTGYWNQIEQYIKDHADVDFTHSICPECTRKFYADFKPE
ncbi:MAG: response regulator [bacterium]